MLVGSEPGSMLLAMLWKMCRSLVEVICCLLGTITHLQ